MIWRHSREIKEAIAAGPIFLLASILKAWEKSTNRSNSVGPHFSQVPNWQKQRTLECSLEKPMSKDSKEIMSSNDQCNKRAKRWEGQASSWHLCRRGKLNLLAVLGCGTELLIVDGSTAVVCLGLWSLLLYIWWKVHKICFQHHQSVCLGDHAIHLLDADPQPEATSIPHSYSGLLFPHVSNL